VFGKITAATRERETAGEQTGGKRRERRRGG